jgi:GNAT superfamily N-acetyltransferase
MMEFRSPDSGVEWETYHQIRREILFERRGRAGEYDADHPDERRPGNHPMVLFVDDVAVAVIRIDLAPPRATFRRVAVRERDQRRGYGTILLRLAEQFALAHGCTDAVSFVDEDAMGFYRKCGFADGGSSAPAHTLFMTKRLAR